MEEKKPHKSWRDSPAILWDLKGSLTFLLFGSRSIFGHISYFSFVMSAGLSVELHPHQFCRYCIKWTQDTRGHHAYTFARLPSCITLDFRRKEGLYQIKTQHHDIKKGTEMNMWLFVKYLINLSQDRLRLFAWLVWVKFCMFKMTLLVSIMCIVPQWFNHEASYLHRFPILVICSVFPPFYTITMRWIRCF